MEQVSGSASFESYGICNQSELVDGLPPNRLIPVRVVISGKDDGAATLLISSVSNLTRTRAGRADGHEGSNTYHPIADRSIRSHCQGWKGSGLLLLGSPDASPMTFHIIRTSDTNKMVERESWPICQQVHPGLLMPRLLQRWETLVPLPVCFST